ncbi:MAG: hypothetical protein Ta2A_19820 [Treponemataceae bacterium]|nr:MAG: hypothetical protein Ta2A_19820 [Treponemataceae bacterium]
MFPESGREQTYQAFKKFGIEEKVQLLNESHTNFYKTLNPDFEHIVSILSEHRKRWRALAKECKAVDLIEKLQSLYKMNKDILGGDSRIYELYFIYENEYLRNQFERFYSAIDFYQWWDCEAMKILNQSI